MRNRIIIAGLTVATIATGGIAFAASGPDDQQTECVTCAVESTTQTPSAPTTEEATVPKNIEPSEVPPIVAAVDVPQPSYTTAVEQPAAPAPSVPIEEASDTETDVGSTSTVAPEPEWGSNERPIPVKPGYNTSIVDGEPVYTPRTTAAPEPTEPEGNQE